MKLGRALLRYAIEVVILGALTLAVLMPWGCGRVPYSTGPVAGNTFTLPNGVLAYPGTTRLLKDSTSGAGYSTAPIKLDEGGTEPSGVFDVVVGVLGGVVTMALPDSEVSFLTIPAGALLASTDIKADVFRQQIGPELRHTQYHFEPDGLLFRLPALLSFKTVEPDGSILVLSWWDPVAKDWVPSAQAVVVAGYATFPVLHFSDYRVVDRISLGGQRHAK